MESQVEVCIFWVWVELGHPSGTPKGKLRLQETNCHVKIFLSNTRDATFDSSLAGSLGDSIGWENRRYPIDFWFHPTGPAIDVRNRAGKGPRRGLWRRPINTNIEVPTSSDHNSSQQPWVVLWQDRGSAGSCIRGVVLKVSSVHERTCFTDQK